MFDIQIPSGAKYIIDELNKYGFEAYIVGGCVRDSLLGKTPNDWDITTSATPYEVKDIFKRTVDTGIEHGTVTVLVDKCIAGKTDSVAGYAFEVTTYRVDGEYKDHRRPESVTFTASLEEDLKRRDFTINAMAYNDTVGLVDIFGGREDLANGIVRCVGNPAERFDEDALRILRAVRFAAQLGFDIEEDTKEAMRKQAIFLRDISAERIQVELTKLITSKNPGMLVTAYELGLTSVILPEFDLMMQTGQNNPHHIYCVGEHTIRVMENVPPDKVLRYAALLHDSGKPACKVTGEDGIDHFYGHPKVSADIARKVLRRLKLDNNTIDSTCKLVLYHDYFLKEVSQAKAFRRFMSKLGKDNFNSYIAIRRADIAGQSDYDLERKLQSIEVLQSLYDEMIQNNQCINLSELAINGKDLMDLGMKPGRQMGEVLNYLLEIVLDEPDINNKEALTELVIKKING